MVSFTIDSLFNLGSQRVVALRFISKSEFLSNLKVPPRVKCTLEGDKSFSFT